jgi:hypothetical protein
VKEKRGVQGRIEARKVDEGKLLVIYVGGLVV